MTIAGDGLAVLLGRRAEAPFAGRWALPGGVVRIDLDKTLEDAVRRVIDERLGLTLPYLRQVCTVGGATRDPRAPWGLSVIYRALVPLEAVAPKPGKRLEALRWWAVDEVFRGVNPWRRLLGAGGLVIAVSSAVSLLR